MKLHPRVRRIQLQIKRGRLSELLLIAGESGAAVREGVRNPEVHVWMLLIVYQLKNQVGKKMAMGLVALPVFIRTLPHRDPSPRARGEGAEGG
jgi:hypothetical protein